MQTFLSWLLDEGLFVHFSVLDPLYWSIVDIVDSILTEHGEMRLMMANWELKDALYTILRHDPDDTVELFQRYSYPNVGRERRSEFVAKMLERLEVRADLLFSAMMLKGVLQIGGKLEALPYLEEETPNVLIDGFGASFVQRICLFKNSSHIVDVEEVIMDYIGAQGFMDGEQPLDIHRFAASHDEPGIQISDIVAGTLGKFFSMIQRSSHEELLHPSSPSLRNRDGRRADDDSPRPSVGHTRPSNEQGRLTRSRRRCLSRLKRRHPDGP
jgi:hypothetical protein